MESYPKDVRVFQCSYGHHYWQSLQEQAAETGENTPSYEQEQEINLDLSNM